MRGVFIAAAIWLLGSAAAHAQAVSTTTTYGYDEAGNKTSQVDPMGRRTSWTFDALNRVTSRALPDGTRELSTYDSEGNLLTRTNFAGEAFSFQYDVNNQLTGQIIPAGTGTNAGVAGASFVATYSPTGPLLTRREQGPTTLGGLQTFRYDVNDRLIGTQSPIGEISYALDAMGQVLERSIPGAGTVKYEHDAAGRLLKVTAAVGKQARYTYDDRGRLTRIDRDLNPVGGQAQFLRTSMGYDDADRLVLISEVKRTATSATFIVGQSLTRGPGGVITEIQTDRGTGVSGSATGNLTAKINVIQSFYYDGLARLRRELRTSDSGTTDTRYEYDLAGNRTKKTVITDIGTTVTSYTYDVADRLTLESTSLMTGGTRVVAYTYDGNGNLASKTEAGKVTLYRFDPRNKLIDIRAGATLAEAQGAAPTVRYAYDADGNRVRKWGLEGTGYLIDASELFPQVAVETTGQGNIQYVRGIGLVRQVKVTSANTEDLYPLHGHLGTSLGALNGDGDLAEQLDADAFGNFDQGTASKLRHLYTGEYWDQDAQLLYLRARWYDPRMGRFISADPFEGAERDPRSLNRYAFAANDPTHKIDPSGKMSLGEFSVATAIVAAAAAAPNVAFAGGMGDLSNSEKRYFAEMYAEQVLGLSTDKVLRNVRGYAMVNGVRVDLEFDRVFLDPSRTYIKVAEVKWGQNSQYTANQRTASLQITQGDIYLTGPQAADNRINPNRTLKEQFGYQHVIFTVNGTRVLRSDITKVRLRNGARLFSHWVINVTGMQ